MSDTSSSDILTLASDVARAFLGHNILPAGDLPSLIVSIYETLASLGTQGPAAIPLEPVVGAVSLRKSLASPDHIISMIDGRPYRTLKRHLGTHGLTPEDYRIRYKLPQDYPMVAPSYAAERSAIAKRVGLGREPVQDPAPLRRKLTIAGPKLA